MQTLRVTTLAALLAVVLLIGGKPVLSAEIAPLKPTKSDKCPVCGMFVAKYPDFLAQIIFRDDSHAFFDGAKDMFKYYFKLNTYTPGKTTADIAAVHVTDYYSMASVDGRTAWYVVGSDVFGPMGRELIPFAKETDAAAFLKDHQGKQLLRFDQVTPEIIKGLD